MPPVRVILPAGPLAVAVTCIPLIVNASALLVPVTVYVMVMVVAVTTIEAPVIFAPAVNVTLPVPAKKLKLAGADKTNVTFVPTAKSALFASVITIFPKVLYGVGNVPEQVPIAREGVVMTAVANKPAGINVPKNTKALSKAASLLCFINRAMCFSKLVIFIIGRKGE